MIFADDVTILRPSGQDAYGNAAADWSNPTPIAAKAFVSGHLTKAYFPTGTDLQVGDRLKWRTYTFDVLDPITVRSPSKDVMMTCGLARVEG